MEVDKSIKAVALVSGGLDSACSLAEAVNRGWDVMALSVDYGQRHQMELKAARELCRYMGVTHCIARAHGLGQVAHWSALTRREHEVPTGRSEADMAEGVPISYVPMRNTNLLALAAALLESRVLEAIDAGQVVHRAVLVIGANAVDYSGYPDCRPEFYEAMLKALRLGSKIGTEHRLGFEIDTPVIGMTKGQVIMRGHDLGVPVHKTYSCYRGVMGHCGVCDSCILREKGFTEARAAGYAV